MSENIKISICIGNHHVNAMQIIFPRKYFMNQPKQFKHHLKFVSKPNKSRKYSEEMYEYIRFRTEYNFNGYNSCKSYFFI